MKKKIAIYGDSLSTYEKWVPEDALFYYPLYSSTVTTVDKTWWHMLISNNNLELHTNVSYSGSTVHGDKTSCGINDIRINKLIVNNTAPDIIVILLGINDVVTGTDPVIFKKSYLEMLSKIKKLCPNTKIIITNLHYETATDGTGNAPESYSHPGLREKYNIIFDEIQKETSLPLVDIASLITNETDSFGNKTNVGDNIHFNDQGMITVYKAVEKVINQL